jgi:hypothetical protein
MMTKKDDLDAGTGSYVAAGSDWSADEKFWRSNYSSRPYASDDRGFEYFRSAYRYGHDAAKRLGARRWSDAEIEVRRGWEKFEGRGERAWDQIKDAVRDAWDRVVGH